MARPLIMLATDDRWGRDATLPVESPPEHDCRVEYLTDDGWRVVGYAKCAADAIVAAHSYRADAGIPARAVGPDGVIPWRPGSDALDLARRLLDGSAVGWAVVQTTRAEVELVTLGGLMPAGPGFYRPVPDRLAAVVAGVGC